MCTLQNSPLQLKPRDLHIVANFVTEGTFQAGAPSTIDLETDDVKGQSYFTGRVVRLIAEYSQAEGRVYEFAVEFNSECRGWHYAWNGSRFKTRVEHVLAVHVYTPVIVTSSSDLAPQSSTSTYAKMASFRSVAFKIASLRRKGGVGLQAQGSAEDLSDEIGSSSEGSLENKEETSSVSDPTNGGKRNNLFLSEDLSLSEENKGPLKKRPSIPSLPRPCDINNVSTGQIVSVLLPNGVLCDSNAIIVSKNIERKSVVIKYLDSLQVDTVPIERVTATNQSMAQVSAMYRNAALDDGRGTI